MLFSPDRGGYWLPVLPDREEKSCVSDVFFVVAIVAEKFKVVMVESNRRVADVFRTDMFLVVNYVTVVFMAALTETAVYCTPFRDERIFALLPFCRIIKRFCIVFRHYFFLLGFFTIGG